MSLSWEPCSHHRCVLQIWVNCSVLSHRPLFKFQVSLSTVSHVLSDDDDIAVICNKLRLMEVRLEHFGKSAFVAFLPVMNEWGHPDVSKYCHGSGCDCFSYSLLLLAPPPPVCVGVGVVLPRNTFQRLLIYLICAETYETHILSLSVHIRCISSFWTPCVRLFHLLQWHQLYGPRSVYIGSVSVFPPVLRSPVSHHAWDNNALLCTMWQVVQEVSVKKTNQKTDGTVY